MSLLLFFWAYLVYFVFCLAYLIFCDLGLSAVSGLGCSLAALLFAPFSSSSSSSTPSSSSLSSSSSSSSLLECSFRIGLLFSRAFICAVAVRSPRSAYLGGQVVGSSSQAQMLQKPKHRWRAVSFRGRTVLHNMWLQYFFCNAEVTLILQVGLKNWRRKNMHCSIVKRSTNYSFPCTAPLTGTRSKCKKGDIPDIVKCLRLLFLVRNIWCKIKGGRGGMTWGQ